MNVESSSSPDFSPVQPQPVYFRNRYVWQDAQWKLAAIDVQLGAPVS
jgi:hypothetical protein